jgi:hypothetical protein
LIRQAGEVWEKDNVKGFVALLAQAFCLDIHDFNHVMDGRKHKRWACAAVDVLVERGADTPEFHIVRMAMSLVERGVLLQRRRLLPRSEQELRPGEVD